MREGSPGRRSDRGAVPFDLLAVVALVTVTLGLAYWSFEPLSPLRALLGLVSALFAPGYVTLLVLLPDAGVDAEPRPGDAVPWSGRRASALGRAAAGLGRAERVVLSVLLSVIVVSLLGILLSLASVGIDPGTVVPTVGGYTLLLAVVAAVGRSARGGSRLDVPAVAPGSWLARLRTPATRTDALLNVALVLLVLVGGAAVAAPSVGRDTAAFTEFYVLDEDGSEDPALREYLSTTGPDEPARISAGITNREHHRLNYTVVVQVQRAEVAGRSLEVVERRQASRLSVELGPDEHVRLPYRVAVDEAETGCRVAFLLYADGVPVRPTAENAYRELHLWHAVDPPDGGEGCPSLDAVEVSVGRPTAPTDGVGAGSEG